MRCASTSRSAMRRRRRLMGTRSTRSAGGPPAARSRSAASRGARRGRRAPGRRRGGRRAFGDVAEHILLREAAILAGAGNGGRIEALLRDQPSHRRAQAARGVLPGGWRRRARAARGVLPGGWRRPGSFSGRRRRGPGGGRRGGLWRTSAAVGAAGPRSIGGGRRGRGDRAGGAGGRRRGRRGLGDPRHDGPDPHRGAFPLHDLQAAGRGRGDLHRRLVRLQLEQRLVRFHGVAVALEPAGDRALAHRLPERRNADLEAHRLARAGRGRRRAASTMSFSSV